jgi:hypothetical protein
MPYLRRMSEISLECVLKKLLHPRATLVRPVTTPKTFSRHTEHDECWTVTCLKHTGCRRVVKCKHHLRDLYKEALAKWFTRSHEYASGVKHLEVFPSPP